MKASCFPLAVLLVVSGIALADDGDAPKDQPAKFKITTKRKDDTVEVQSEKDKTLFIMKSPFGISQAVIEREGEKWPDAAQLQRDQRRLAMHRCCGQTRLLPRQPFDDLLKGRGHLPLRLIRTGLAA
jgi:hypothetical protein